MFIKLTSMAGNESYINFDKVFSITPKPYGSLLYMEEKTGMIMSYEVKDKAEDIVKLANRCSVVAL